LPLNRDVPAEFPSGAAWSDDDVEKMLRLIEGGSSLHELARLLGRTDGDIAQQASFLGVLIPQHEALRIWTRTADSSGVSASIHYAPFAQSPRRTSS